MIFFLRDDAKKLSIEIESSRKLINFVICIDSLEEKERFIQTICEIRFFTMTNSNAFRSNSLSSTAPLLLRIISLSCCIALVSLSPLVAGIKSPAAECPPIGAAETRMDLSYLHRCGEGEIATTIQGRLEKQQIHQTVESNDVPILDIDLTASLIGKNISGILASLTRSDDVETQKDDIFKKIEYQKRTASQH